MDGSKVLKNLLEAIGLRKKDTAATGSGGQGVSVTPSSFARTYKVYIEEGGKRYHRDEKCSGMKKPKYVTLEYARKKGYTECKKCMQIK